MQKDKGEEGELDRGRQLENKEREDLLGNESSMLLLKMVKLFISFGQRIF